MVARTKIGSSFNGALGYAANDKTLHGEIVMKDRSELLYTSNLLSKNWQDIAKEMQTVGEDARCKKQVWHTSLSWDGKKEQPNKEEMITAANKYCEKVGADPNRHQIAVYEHKDTPNPHIHIYINRVPIDRSKALDTSFNYAQNLKVCKEIAQEMNWTQLPEKRQSVKDHFPEIEKARTVIKSGIKEALESKVKSVTELSDYLSQKGIESQFKHDSKNNLVGSSFRVNEIALKGQEVGFKAKEINQILTKNQESDSKKEEKQPQIESKKEVSQQKDNSSEIERTKTFIQDSIKEVLDSKIQTVQSLYFDLYMKGIQPQFEVDSDKRKLEECSFEMNGITFKGEEIGYSATQINETLTKNVVQSFDEAEFKELDEYLEKREFEQQFEELTSFLEKTYLATNSLDLRTESQDMEMGNESESMDREDNSHSQAQQHSKDFDLEL